VDDLDDNAELRARAEAIERRQTRLAEVLGVAWRAQIAAETPTRDPQRMIAEAMAGCRSR
jgi:hypothetical protein